MIGLLIMHILAAGAQLSASTPPDRCDMGQISLVSPPTCSGSVTLARSGRSDLQDAHDELMRYRAAEQERQQEWERRRSQEIDVEQQRLIEENRRHREEEAARQERATQEMRALAQQQLEDQRRAAERERAEREKVHEQVMEEARKQSEQSRARARAEDEARDRHNEMLARERAKPENKLKRLYTSYIGVRKCYDSRAGKLYVYIDTDDFADAKRKAHDIERKLLREQPGLDRGAIWGGAQEPELDFFWFAAKPDLENGELTNDGRDYCRKALATVRQMYLEFNPDADTIQKDF